jgi:hypothetical protein
VAGFLWLKMAIDRNFPLDDDFGQRQRRLHDQDSSSEPILSSAFSVLVYVFSLNLALKSRNIVNSPSSTKPPIKPSYCCANPTFFYFKPTRSLRKYVIKAFYPSYLFHWILPSYRGRRSTLCEFMRLIKRSDSGPTSFY